MRSLKEAPPTIIAGSSVSYRRGSRNNRRYARNHFPITATTCRNV